MSIDPRTHPGLVRLCSTVHRAGVTFTTFTYYARQSDFDLLCVGKTPLHMCYRSRNNEPCKGFKPRATVGAFRKMMTAWREEQRGHMYGARAMESDWRC